MRRTTGAYPGLDPGVRGTKAVSASAGDLRKGQQEKEGTLQYTVIAAEVRPLPRLSGLRGLYHQTRGRMATFGGDWDSTRSALPVGHAEVVRWRESRREGQREPMDGAEWFVASARSAPLRLILKNQHVPGAPAAIRTRVDVEHAAGREGPEWIMLAHGTFNFSGPSNMIAECRRH